MRLPRVLWKSFLDFFRDDGFILAGSLSYSMIMALFPFCLFLITLFGYFLGQHPEFFHFFLARMADLFPDAAGTMRKEILKLVSYRGLGKFSILLFAFLSYQAFASLEFSLNTVFKIQKRRGIFFSLVVSLAVVSMLMVVIIGSFAAATVVPLLASSGLFPMGLSLSRISGFVVRFVLPFGAVLIATTALYQLLPRTKVRIGAALKGALFTTLLLETAKILFTWYVRSIAEFGRIYGPLTAFVLVLLWIFYSSCIFLIGAELVHNLDSGPKTARA